VIDQSTPPADPPADPPPTRLGRPRATCWRRVSRGLYVRGDQSGDDLHAWQEVLPAGGAFTGLTAAGLRGWWLPPAPADVPVFAAVPRAGGRPRRQGLHVTRHPQAPPAEELCGLRVARPTEVLLACAADLGLLDLVVLLDAALRSGACTAEEVRAASRQPRRGVVQLRAALDLADPRAESAWEVLLRLLHVVCDVPVEPQHEVRHDGVLLGRADLWIPGTRTIQEYDGADHLDARQYRDDRRRDRRLTERGWVRNGYTAPDLLTRAVAVLRDADRALDRPHEPERVRAWHTLLQESLFTDAGTARLRLRWGLDVPSGHLRRGSGTSPGRS